MASIVNKKNDSKDFVLNYTIQYSLVYRRAIPAVNAAYLLVTNKTE